MRILRFGCSSILLATTLTALGCASATDPSDSDSEETASTSSTLQRPGGDERCAILIDKIQPGETSSRVLSTECVKAGESFSAEIQDGTPLMQWYDGPNFTGANTLVTGRFGACDSDGYKFDYVGDAWNDIISSFKSFSWCNNITAYSEINRNLGCTANCRAPVWNFPGSESVHVAYVGDSIDHRISSFHIRRR